MAIVTSEGIAPTTLAGYLTRFGTAFRTALGSDLDLAPESPQGQLIEQLALILTQEDEALVAIGNGQSADRAIGRQVDDLYSLLDVTRLLSTHSSVDVTLSGVATTVIPDGARARTAAGDLFALVSRITIPVAGTVTATMRAVEVGPVMAAAGALMLIVDPIAGWTGVTNAAAATPGRNAETDQQYRARYGRTLAHNASGPLDAIEAALRGTDGVTDALVAENATDASVTVQTLTIGAYSVMAIVEGGTDGDVGASIARAKSAGTGTSGAESVVVPHAGGRHTTTIRFQRVTTIPITVAVDTAFGVGFPGDGTALITLRLVDWMVGDWTSGPGDFDTSGLTIGATLDTNRLLSPIQSVPGHIVQTVTVERRGGGALGTPALNERFTLAAADVSVS